MRVCCRLITELISVCHHIHHSKSFTVIITVICPLIAFFRLQAQKEGFAHKLISAQRAVLAQYPAQLGPTPTSVAGLCVPAVLPATTAHKGPATSLSSLAPLASTVLMVDPKQP